MQRLTRRSLILLALLSALVLGSWTAFAENPVNTYELQWFTMDNGGTMSANGGSFALSGTAGQVDANAPGSSGAYAVQGGFWGIGQSLIFGGYEVYLPQITRP